MLLQEQILNEINHISPNKLPELYSIIHYFRLGLLHEKEQSTPENKYPLRSQPIFYQDPFEPVAIEDLEILK